MSPCGSPAGSWTPAPTSSTPGSSSRGTRSRPCGRMTALPATTRRAAGSRWRAPPWRSETGADPEDAVARLLKSQPDLEPVPTPSIVDNLGEIGSTPWLLAGFLVLIGAAGLAHSLTVSVRRHRHDVAVVRALGLRPVQARSVVRWQAAVPAVLGAGLGLVVGVLVGRVIWQRIVHGVGALVVRRRVAVDGPARAAPRARARIGPGGSRGSAGRAPASRGGAEGRMIPRGPAVRRPT